MESRITLPPEQTQTSHKDEFSIQAREIFLFHKKRVIIVCLFICFSFSVFSLFKGETFLDRPLPDDL